MTITIFLHPLRLLQTKSQQHELCLQRRPQCSVDSFRRIFSNFALSTKCNWSASQTCCKSQTLVLTLWCFHFVFVDFCLLRSNLLDAAVDFGNSQLVYVRFPVYRFHSQKHRDDQQQRNKGQKRRNFVENVATFEGRCQRFIHDLFDLTTKISETQLSSYLLDVFSAVSLHLPQGSPLFTR